MRIKLRYNCFVSLLTITCLQVLGAEKAESVPGFAPRQGFESQEQAWTCKAGVGSKLQASAQTTAQVAAGWHVITGEYRTSGLSTLQTFNLRASLTNKQPVWSANSGFAASSEWVPLRLYCRLEKPGNLRLQVISREPMQREVSVSLRKVMISAWSVKPKVNLLAQGDFTAGSLGELPALWSSRYAGADNDYALAEDNSFKRGDKTMRIRSDGKKGRTLQGIEMPFPKHGILTFSVWARSTAPEMTITLRLLGDQYRWHWKRSWQLTKTWQRFEVSGSCGTKRKRSFVWPRIDIKGVGDAFVADARMEWKAADDSTGKKSPWLGTVGRNRLINPGFELGLTGWMFDRFRLSTFDKRLEQINAAQDRIIPRQGMDHSAALYLPWKRSLVSACVPVKRGKTYTISVYARAVRDAGEMCIFLIDPGWKIFRKRIETVPSDKWTRYSHTFKWDKPTKQGRAYVRIDTRSEAPLLIDNVQLEEGELTEYSPPPVELGIMSPDGNLVTQNTTPEFMLQSIPHQAVQADAQKKYVAEIVVQDAWGTEIQRQTLQLPLNRQDKIPLALPAGRLGLFAVRITARGAGDRLLGLSMHRYAVIKAPVTNPGHGNPSGLPLFGLCYENSASHLWLAKRDALLMQRMGVGLNRFFLYLGGKVTGNPSAEYLASLAAVCEAEQKAGIQQIACLNSVPRHLQAAIVKADNPEDEDLARLAEYFRRFVTGLQAQVRYWEVLNEPNLWRHRNGPRKGFKTMPPEKYVRLLRVVHRMIKGVDPKLQVVAPCLNGARFVYLEKLMSLGAARYMDVFSFHSYRASPENPDTYTDLMRFREILDRHGFHGPMINTEQYYAFNMFMLRGSDEESRRAYYVPGGQELRSAGRTIRNYIHHAAAGVPYCAFNPRGTLFRRGGVDGGLLLALVPAYSAAVRFLSSAGRGVPVSMGSAMRAFVFTGDPKGPLVTLNTNSSEYSGRIRLAESFVAYDIMGNRLHDRDIAGGLPLATDPVYVRFPKGTSGNDIRAVLRRAEVRGLGNPVSVAVGLAGMRLLAIQVTNLQNRVLTGTVHLEKTPPAWVFSRTRAIFEDLQPGMSMQLKFSAKKLPVRNLGQYDLTVLAEMNNAFVRKNVTISPVLARWLEPVNPDGDIAEWQSCEWLMLDRQRLSRDFNPELAWTGKQDLSARVACAWNAKGLGLCVEVTDDKWMPPAAIASAWKNDCLQVYFDQSNNANPLHPRYDADDVSYVLAMVRGEALAYVDKGSEGRYVGEANSETGIDREVKLAIVRKGDKTIYEAFFPSAVLPRAEIRAGKALGFSLLINDNDGKGRKVGLTLAPRGKEPCNHPHEFRDLILMPGPAK